MNSIHEVSSYAFSLAPHIYAASFGEAIIILDSKENKYFSLIDDAAHSLRFILEHEFIQQPDGTYYRITDDDNIYHDWISYFIEQQFITPGTQLIPLASPLQEGGLTNYSWDTRKSWKPFSQAALFSIFQAYRMLLKVHRSIKRKGMVEIFDWIREGKRQHSYDPSPQEMQKLAASVDAASLLYPKHTLCLAWATTFVLLALRKNWKINLVIGVQTTPFYSHAWAETSSGEVINDEQLVSQALSVLFKEPYK